MNFQSETCYQREPAIEMSTMGRIRIIEDRPKCQNLCLVVFGLSLFLAIIGLSMVFQDSPAKTVKEKEYRGESGRNFVPL